MDKSKLRRQSWFSRQKLNIKFTIVIGVLLFVPIASLLVLLFANQQSNMNKQAIDSMKYSMAGSAGDVEKTVDLCNTSTQVFLNYRNLGDYLLKLKNGEEIDTIDLVDFYNNDIGMLQNLVNSNPYLYQIRVYADNSDFYEMMPILFTNKRLDQFQWSMDYTSGEWVFNYQDTVFGDSVNPSDHTMGLITNITDYELGKLAVIEVAVRMEDVFEEIFQSTDREWIGLVQNDSMIYSGTSDESFWETHKSELVEGLGELQLERYLEIDFNGHPAIVGILPIKDLNATLIRIRSMEENYASINQIKSYYVMGLILAFILLIIMVNTMVKLMLRQFYNVLGIIEKIQDGDLEARVNNKGTDEMGVLGMQIDKMLDTIERLLQENINRELLMKNSEIKALQNQINAHFIYNVLESIKMMAEIDEKYEISDAVTSLGKLLRYGMRWTTKNVTVGEEIDYIRHYLELANLRFDYDVHLSLNIPDWAFKQQIPKISIQPIVENAIYHGIEDMAEDASIYIKVNQDGRDMVIEITDSGVGMTTEDLENIQKKITGELEAGGGTGNGIGLKNVQDRIQITFGEQYGIQILSKEACFTKVSVRLPITNWEVLKHE